MKPFFSVLAGTVALLIAGGPSARAQATNVLKVYTAIKVEFLTQIGKLYTLQGASDLTNWTDIGAPIYGHGRVVDQFFSTKTVSNVNFTAYQLKIEDGPTNGCAPWQMSGHWMALCNDAVTNVVRCDDEARGHDAYGTNRDNFTYQYSRRGENEAELQRHYGEDRADRLTLSYSGAGEGTWVREEFRHGALERRQMGQFHCSTNAPGTMPPPVVIPTNQPSAPPIALAGFKLHVRAGDLPIELKFISATAGREEAGEARHGAHLPETPFAYEYTVLSSNTASLNLNFGTNNFDGERNEYDLTFTSGVSGTFARRVIRFGEVASTDNGVFGPDHTEVEDEDDHRGRDNEPGEDNSGRGRGGSDDTSNS